MFTQRKEDDKNLRNVHNVLILLAVPVIIDLKEQYEVSIGQNFSLNCLSDGNPKPEVWWEKKEYDKFARVKNSHSQLTFGMMKEEDFGSYVCVARNNIDQARKEVAIGMYNSTHMVTYMNHSESLILISQLEIKF